MTKKGLFQRLTSGLRDQEGQIAILVGLMLPVLLGVTGLVIDGGLLFFEHRNARNASDAAALAGARELWKGAAGSGYVNFSCAAGLSGNAAIDAACAVATYHGYQASEVTVNMPPQKSTTFRNETGNIEVVVTRQQETLLIRLVGPEYVTVSAFAVGGSRPSSPAYAIYALSKTACPGLDIAANNDLTVGGGIVVNAECLPPPSGDHAMDKSGGGDVVVDGPVDVVGDYDESGGGTVVPPPTEGGDGVPDPLAGLDEVVTAWVDTAPLDGTVDAAVLSSDCRVTTDTRCSQSYTITWMGGPVDVGVVSGSLRTPPYVSPLGNPQTFNVCAAPQADHPSLGLFNVPTLYPGVYPGGIKRSGSCSVVVFMSGVYVFAGRDTSGPTVDLDISVASDGAGVLWYITDISPRGGGDPNCNGVRCGFGSVNISTSGSKTVNLYSEPPPPACLPQDTYEGLLMFYDRSASAPLCDETSGNCTNDVFIQGGGAAMRLSGSLYDRKGRLRANGSYDFLQAQLIFNVVFLQSSGPVTIEAPDCGPGTERFPFLRE